MEWSSPFVDDCKNQPYACSSHQESTLSSQYLSALSAHFVYWSSADVAMLLLRAVRSTDPLTGEPELPEAAAEEGGSTANY